MIVGKWNYEKQDYEPYVLPEEWRTPLYCEDMGALIDCAQCGREIEFGDAYTSLEIHNGLGFGYPVCEDCYREEWERRNEYELGRERT